MNEWDDGDVSYRSTFTEDIFSDVSLIVDGHIFAFAKLFRLDLCTSNMSKEDEQTKGKLQLNQKVSKE